MTRHKTIKRILLDSLDNQQGLALLKHLKSQYMDPSCFDADSHRMAYKVGQRELVQDLLAAINKDEKIDAMDIYQFDI